jgi:signal transduction histidine kinase
MIKKTNSTSFSNQEEEILYLRKRIKELESVHQQQQFEAVHILADFSADLIFWMDSALHILGHNKAVAQLLTSTGEKSVSNIFGKVSPLVADIAEVLKSGVAAERKNTEATFGTEVVSLQYTIYPYADLHAPGDISGIICIASVLPQKEIHAPVTNQTDIVTERMEELMTANEQLKKVNTDLDNFIYTASHDLRSPIANLEGLVTLLSKSLENKLGEDELTMFNMMQKAVSRFKSTINDLTQIISIDKNFAEGSEPLDFNDLVEHVQTDIGQLIRESGSVITVDAQVPSIHFARKNLRSIIYNLVVNAIKYRSPERQLQIHIKTRKVEQYTVLSVQDNGLGIRADQKDKLFAMFHRVHTHIQGTGIGLYVVKRIVDNNKGKIEVDSEVGKGTTFHVYLLSETESSHLTARDIKHVTDRGKQP